MDSNAGYRGRRFFDYVVVGCGGIGSAAVYWLSKRAKEGVLGIEQFELGHSNGGSQDHSRVIRLGYHEEIYSKLTPDTYKAWEEIEIESGLQILYKTGGLQLAKKGEKDDIAYKYSQAMKASNIDHEVLSGTQVRARYPQFKLDDSYVALYQKDSGMVDAAVGNAVHAQLARGNGATIVDKCAVLRLDKDARGIVTVHTTKGIFNCRRLIVTAGAWVNHVLGSIGVNIPIYVTQEQVTYFGTPHMKEFTKEKCPVWCYHTSKYDIYGTPIHGNTGAKIGIDVGGPVVTPYTRSFLPDKSREKVCLETLREILPTAVGPILYTKTCLYAMPPDRNFVIDTCAEQGWKQVIVCNGAGHAYKFAGLLGKILSQLAIDNRTEYDISPFALNRTALKDPTFKPVFHMGSENGFSVSDKWNLPVARL